MNRGVMVTRIATLAGSVLLLAACSAAGSSSVPSVDPLTAEMVARHPSCATHTRVESDGGVSCTTEGHLFLVYVDAPGLADAARTLHPAGTVDVESGRVWVTE